MAQYEIVVRIEFKQNYTVEAESKDEAFSKAIKEAIEEHPEADVWVD